MTRKSTGFFAVMALVIGLAGLGTTGCGLDTTGTVQPPTDTMNNDPPVENVVPIDRASLEEEAR